MPFASLDLPPEENESILRSIEDSIEESGWFKLPKHIEEQPDRPFVCFVMIRVKPGMEQVVIDISKDIRAETDQNELEVYAHRTLRAKDEVDQNMMCIVIDYDSADAFKTHYRGKNVQRLYRAGVLAEPPKLNFFVDT